MQKFQNNIQDQFGNKLTGLTITVRNVVGGGLSTIFSDDGVTPKANPFVEATSEFFFYADNGRYDVFITGAESDEFTDVLLFDIAGGGAGTVPVSTQASSVLRGDGVGGWVENTDVSISATGNITTDGSYIISDGVDTLTRNATAGVELWIGTGGFNRVDTIRMRIPSPLQISEAATVLGDVAGIGQLILKNTSPNTLFFRDDLGTEFQLGGGGGSPVATPFDIQANILVPTPPTSASNPTALLNIYDLDSSDRLAYFGFEGTAGLEYRNLMRGGFSYMRGINTLGVLETYLQANPDDSVLLTFPGFVPKKQKFVGLTRRFATAFAGINVYGSFDYDGDPTLGEDQDAVLDLRNNTGALIGEWGFLDQDTTMSIFNDVYGGRLELWTTDATGGGLDQININPTQGVTIMNHVAGRQFRFVENPAAPTSKAQFGRFNLTGTDGGTAGNHVNIGFVDNILTPVDRATIGFEGSDTFRFANKVNGANVFILGRQTGGATSFIVSADPDAATSLGYNGTIRARTANNLGSGILTGFQVEDSLGNYQDVGVAKYPNMSLGVTGTPFSNNNWGKTLNFTAVTTQTTYTNIEANQLLIPDGTAWPVENDSGGNVTLAPGTGVTLKWMDGLGVTTGTRTLADGAAGVLRKVNNTEYRWIGNGTT